MNWTQQDAPLMDALKEHLMNRVVRFDVPGHKGGRGNHELADFLGQRCVQIDVKSLSSGFRAPRCTAACRGSVRGCQCLFYHQRCYRCFAGYDYVGLQSR